VLEILASTLRLSTPLLFAAMGGVLCERAGIATICLEGAMIAGAWAAAVVNLETHNPWLGLVAGIVAGALVMCVHAALTLGARAQAIVSGVAVNLLALGLTPSLDKALYGSPTNTPSIPLGDRFTTVLGLPVLVYGALALPFAVHLLFSRTGWGLWITAAGDKPDALRALGISPVRVRLAALLAGGAMAGIGGVYLSIAHASQFTRDMTAGRGFIALAAVIFGKWKPLPAAAACLVFGVADMLQIHLQSVELWGTQVPVQFVQALPYVVTLVVLAGFVGKAVPPRAIVDGGR